MGKFLLLQARAGIKKSEIAGWTEAEGTLLVYYKGSDVPFEVAESLKEDVLEWLIKTTAREEFQHLQEIAHEIAVRKGWWETERTITHQLMKMVTELAEAEEEISKNTHQPWEVYHKDGVPQGFPVELADVVIRIFDTATRYNISMADIIVDKMWYNTTRPYRHGGKAT